MTTYTITFPHREGTPIAVLRHPLDTPDYEWAHHPLATPTYHVSLASVLRLVRCGCDKPRLVQLPDGIALEVTVTKGDN